jgi:hypothetical protein
MGWRGPKSLLARRRPGRPLGAACVSDVWSSETRLVEALVAAVPGRGEAAPCRCGGCRSVGTSGAMPFTWTLTGAFEASGLGCGWLRRGRSSEGLIVSARGRCPCRSVCCGRGRREDVGFIARGCAGDGVSVQL